MTTQDDIIEILRHGPLTAKEISKKTGIPLSTVYNRIVLLKEYALIQREKKLYSLTLKGRKYLEVIT